MASSESKILQASAIPFRWRDGQLEFCLITTVRKGRWSFPKGIIDPGETHVDTALKEAYEEAGLQGRIVGEPLGQYHHSKWKSTLEVTVSLMEVTHIEATWQESHQRERRWGTHEEATTLLHRTELVELLQVAVERLQPQSRQAS